MEIFKVGDIVTGIAESDRYYVYTNQHAKMRVAEVKGDMIKVIMLEGELAGTPFDVMASQFRLISRPEQIETIDKKDIINDLVNEGIELLDRMQVYTPNYDAVKFIMEEAWEAKSELRDVLRNHPNWNERKQMIVFDADYPRDFSKEAIYEFTNWLLRNISTKSTSLNIVFYTKQEKNSIKEILTSWGVEDQTGDVMYWHDADADANCITLDYPHMFYEREMQSIYSDYEPQEFIDKADDIQELLNNYVALQFINSINGVFFDNSYDGRIDALNKIDDRFRIRNNMKASKAILKICRVMGWDKVGGTYIHRNGTERSLFDKKFTELSDSINPLNITRHTIISINPIDYWTMSFGHKWSSCHTIDKDGVIRRGGSSYGGCYSAGTESYMLDNHTLVFYTVDRSYNGDRYELEDKMNRCMFHIGEEKIIQGRVYPQANDGATDLYKSIREIMQRVWAEAADIPNLWKNVKGTEICGDVSIHWGSHYRDILEFEDCNVSFHGSEKNMKKINIGRNPICPCCGDEHIETETIECAYCYRRVKECVCCGCEMDPDDMWEIDGEYYCDDCTFYCEYHGHREVNRGNVYYIEGYGSVCEDAIDYSTDFSQCAWCDEWFYTENGITTSDGGDYCCEDCARNDGYMEASDGTWYPEDEFVECKSCGCVDHESIGKHIGDDWYCEDCADTIKDEEVA